MMVSMGDIPDIVKTGGWAQEFFKDGMLMDLTDEVKNWDIYPRLTEGRLQRMSYGDQICAMNYNTNTMFIFYNKELLEKIGAEVPKTFEDLKAIGEKIVAEGITTEDGQKVYATNIPTNNTWELSPWVFSMRAEYMNEDYSQVVIDSPESNTGAENTDGAVPPLVRVIEPGVLLFSCPMAVPYQRSWTPAHPRP